MCLKRSDARTLANAADNLCVLHGSILKAEGPCMRTNGVSACLKPLMFPRQPGSTGGTGLMESDQSTVPRYPVFGCPPVPTDLQNCFSLLHDYLISGHMSQRKTVMVCLNLQVSSPTSGKRSMRMAKLNWFVLASVFQCGKIYLWLSHTNLVDSMLAFYLIFSRSLHNKYKSRMHKQSAWHLQFILVTENLIDE